MTHSKYLLTMGGCGAAVFLLWNMIMTPLKPTLEEKALNMAEREISQGIDQRVDDPALKELTKQAIMSTVPGQSSSVSNDELAAKIVKRIEESRQQAEMDSWNNDAIDLEDY